MHAASPTLGTSNAIRRGRFDVRFDASAAPRRGRPMRTDRGDARWTRREGAPSERTAKETAGRGAARPSRGRSRGPRSSTPRRGRRRGGPRETVERQPHVAVPWALGRADERRRAVAPRQSPPRRRWTCWRRRAVARGLLSLRWVLGSSSVGTGLERRGPPARRGRRPRRWRTGDVRGFRDVDAARVAARGVLKVLRRRGRPTVPAPPPRNAMAATSSRRPALRGVCGGASAPTAATAEGTAVPLGVPELAGARSRGMPALDSGTTSRRLLEASGVASAARLDGGALRTRASRRSAYLAGGPGSFSAERRVFAPADPRAAVPAAGGKRPPGRRGERETVAWAGAWTNKLEMA